MGRPADVDEGLHGGASPLALRECKQRRGQRLAGLHQPLQHHREIGVGDAPGAEERATIGGNDAARRSSPAWRPLFELPSTGARMAARSRLDRRRTLTSVLRGWNEVAAEPGHELARPRPLLQIARQERRVLRRRPFVFEVLDDGARLGQREIPVDQRRYAGRERSVDVRRGVLRSFMQLHRLVPRTAASFRSTRRSRTGHTGWSTWSCRGGRDEKAQASASAAYTAPLANPRRRRAGEILAQRRRHFDGLLFRSRMMVSVAGTPACSSVSRRCRSSMPRRACPPKATIKSPSRRPALRRRGCPGSTETTKTPLSIGSA